MNPEAMAVEDRFEARHWWFEGRRRLFRASLEPMRRGDSTAALDIGCGTGGNLRVLRGLAFSRITGIDISPAAVEYCRRKGFDDVHEGAVEALPLGDAEFDIALLTDVLEHVKDDSAALREVGRVLAPGGTLIVTVPAFMGLWGRQDEVSHHLRRYRAPEVTRIMESSGFIVEEVFYFNWILAAPIWLARRLLALMNSRIDSENSLTPGPLNVVLRWLFALDVRLAPHLRPRFGVSIFIRGRKVA